MEGSWELVGRPQWPAIKRVVSQARHRLTVVTPFVSREAAARLLEVIGAQPEIQVQFLTAADPNAMISRACDPTALSMIAKRCGDERIHRLHGLHAKVYIADDAIALLTSANLTGAGAWYNYEYGVSITDSQAVGAVSRDIGAYLSIATALPLSSLLEIEDLLAAGGTGTPDGSDRHHGTVVAIEDILVREHVTGKSEHEIFANSVFFVLRRESPLPTAEIHARIQALHPELCDGRDRVIDGRNFGKRWKHQVRNAQQYLKDKGVIKLADGQWQLVNGR